MTQERETDRCSVCGMPFEDTGKKQQCRRCGMFANLCCDPQVPVESCSAASEGHGAAAQNVPIPIPP